MHNCVNNYLVLYSTCELGLLSQSYVLYQLPNYHCGDYTSLINHVRVILQTFVWMVKVIHGNLKTTAMWSSTLWPDFGGFGK